MKYYKRLGIYKASNVEFNPSTMRAYSYGWWRFVDKIKGKVVFNSYRYSATTSGHQRKVLGQLRDLGIAIDLFIKAPAGLQNLQSALEYHTMASMKLLLEMHAPRSRKSTNAVRMLEHIKHEEKIRELRKLLK